MAVTAALFAVVSRFVRTSPTAVTVPRSSALSNDPPLVTSLNLRSPTFHSLPSRTLTLVLTWVVVKQTFSNTNTRLYNEKSRRAEKSGFPSLAPDLPFLRYLVGGCGFYVYLFLL